MNYTTIEQSKKLLELGLNPETADMWWAPDADTVIPTPYITKTDDETLIPAYKGAVPCWSLGALLELIPNYQLQTQNKNIGILFSCRKEFKIIEASTPTEAAYNMVRWLLENKYIKRRISYENK